MLIQIKEKKIIKENVIMLTPQMGDNLFNVLQDAQSLSRKEDKDVVVSLCGIKNNCVLINKGTDIDEVYQCFMRS